MPPRKPYNYKIPINSECGRTENPAVRCRSIGNNRGRPWGPRKPEPPGGKIEQKTPTYGKATARQALGQQTRRRTRTKGTRVERVLMTPAVRRAKYQRISGLMRKANKKWKIHQITKLITNTTN